MSDDSTTPVMPPVATPAPVADVPASAPTDVPTPAIPPTYDSDIDSVDSPAIVTPTPTLPTTDTASDIPADIPTEVARRIGEAHNVLIALSSDPSVDELAAAIGLSIYLDKLGKRATAIYSGATPNALEFLNPEETFESTADTLQDFVIALSKEKADHLRYKLDGDYVKIYITPYRHRISEDDLDFSYGDYNVDLVLALDVANGADLDSALREHGRIMHDASIVNITAGNPGKFGEIEWSDKSASSVSEMIARLIYSFNTDVELGKEEATAFLTGIVAATDRFSNATTTPETMKLSSRLMESGANQQLISKNITADINNEMFSISMSSDDKDTDTDPTGLDIEHNREESPAESEESEEPEKSEESEKSEEPEASEDSPEPEFSTETTQPEESTDSAAPAEPAPTEFNEAATQSDAAAGKESVLLDDLKAAEATLAQTGAEATPDLSGRPVRLGETDEQTLTEPVDVAAPTSPAVAPPSGTEGINANQPEKVITPSADFTTEVVDEGSDKYGKMLEEALADVNSVNITNPATISAPTVPANPEINGVPSINYMPMPGDEVLPPPPTPPIDASTPADISAPVDVATPVAPVTPDAPTSPTLPTMPTEPTAQVGTPAPTPPTPSQDPSAFRIPGM